jgi:hypothetical protein
MTALTFTEGPGYVLCDGARMDRDQCERLLDLFNREHDELMRIGSIEATCWARKIRRSWLALSFAASLSFEDKPSAEVIPLNVKFRTLDRRWPATPYDGAA